MTVVEKLKEPRWDGGLAKRIVAWSSMPLLALLQYQRCRKRDPFLRDSKQEDIITLAWPFG